MAEGKHGRLSPCERDTLKTLTLLITFAGLLIITACGESPAGPGQGTPASDDPDWPPDNYVLPEPDTSLDPDRLVFGEIIAWINMVPPCSPTDQLAHMRDRDEWVLVDVHFSHSVPVDEYGDPLGIDHWIEMVTSRGGRVLFQYDGFPIVRARMLMSQIVDMVDREGFPDNVDWEKGPLPVVRSVPDPTRYDMYISVIYDRLVTDDDIAFFESIGGRVLRLWEHFPFMHGKLPYRSVSLLRQQPHVVAFDNYGWPLHCRAIVPF